MVDNKKIRASRISLNQKFAVPCAERLGNHLAWSRMYGRLSLACSHACARYAVAVNVVDVMEDNEVRLVWRKRMLGGAARAAHERNGNKKQEAAHAI